MMVVFMTKELSINMILSYGGTIVYLTQDLPPKKALNIRLFKVVMMELEVVSRKRIVLQYNIRRKQNELKTKQI